MIINEKSTLAVVGDANLVTLLRLAGIGRYNIIENSDNIEKDVRQIIKELMNEPEISIIVMQSEYIRYIQDMIDRLNKEKRLTPVIIEVPSRSGAGVQNATAYYRSLVRKFVGFDIEI